MTSRQWLYLGAAAAGLWLLSSYKRATATPGEVVLADDYTLHPAAAAQSDGSALDAVSFSAAFAQARAAGLSSFTWRGNKYTTKLAGE